MEEFIFSFTDEYGNEYEVVEDTDSQKLDELIEMKQRMEDKYKKVQEQIKLIEESLK